MTILATDLHSTLRAAGITFFTGVPDSVLRAFCNQLEKTCSHSEHIIAANEGGALALALGHYLASDQLALVYLQNSGLGNIINPLLSLADDQVYAVPMLLLIGWRGEPGQADEPQHIKQGRVTLPMLQAMEIPVRILEGSIDAMTRQVHDSVDEAITRCGPVALLVQRGTIDDQSPEVEKPVPRYTLSRESAIDQLLNIAGDNACVVGSTGMIGREVFALREARGETHERDFLCVGGMGHASQIALAIAMRRPELPVWCLDGDGAALMHLGALAIIAQFSPSNFYHVVLNNGVHESVGGQATAAFHADLSAIAKAAGYAFTARTENAAELADWRLQLERVTGPGFLDLRIRPGHRQGLGRPHEAPVDSADSLKEFLNQ